jgi:hypothetical protein
MAADFLLSIVVQQFNFSSVGYMQASAGHRIDIVDDNQTHSISLHLDRSSQSQILRRALGMYFVVHRMVLTHHCIHQILQFKAGCFFHTRCIGFDGENALSLVDAYRLDAKTGE